MAERYSIEHVELELEIDVIGRFGPQTISLPAVRYADNWALNDIPHAQVNVALGRYLHDLSTPSEVHSLLGTLRDKLPARVYATLVTTDRQNAPELDAWPQGRFLIFLGQTVGAGYFAGTDAGADYVLGLEHWLADLNYASAVSPQTHPQNPAAFLFRASHSSGGGGAGGGASDVTYLHAAHVVLDFVNQLTLRADLWAGSGTDPAFPAKDSGIRGYYDLLAQGDALAEVVGSLPPGLTPGVTQVDTRAALARFEPDAKGRYHAGVPLRLDFAGASDSTMTKIAIMIADLIAEDRPETLANHTVWDKLIGYTQALLFAVVPRVESALLVPFCGLLATPHKVIGAGEYDLVSWKADLPRILRGVGLYGGFGFQAGADGSAGSAVDYDLVGLGGSYLAPDRQTGLFKLFQAPPWCARLPYQIYTPSVAGGGIDPVPTSFDPDPTLEQAVRDFRASLVQPKQALTDQVPFLNRFARSLFAQEVVKLRQGDIACRLRFDIAPGSIVEVQGAGEVFVAEQDVLGEGFFASVRQVTTTLDAEGHTATTSFHLADIRTRSENALSSLGQARHPLWLDVWKGASLIQEPVPAGPPEP